MMMFILEVPRAALEHQISISTEMNASSGALVISAADECPVAGLAKFKDKSSNLQPDKCVVWVRVGLLLMVGYLL